MTEGRHAEIDLAARAGDVWNWARDCDFAGSDPYDGLNSRLLKPLLGGSRLLRLAVIQTVKRSPLDLRPLLRVPPGRNPKGLALFLSGLKHQPSLPDADALRTRIVDLMLASASLEDGTPAFDTRDEQPGLDARAAAPSDDPEPIGWGYHFPWQARAFLQPAYAPTVVATSFVLDALADAGAASYPEICRRAAAFVTRCLHRHETDDGVCFSYSPTDMTRVYNASLFAGKILSRAAEHVTMDLADDYRKAALAAGDFVCNRQRDDGAWIYGEASHWQWVDNLHTGFNLESLDFIESTLEPGRWTDPIADGLDYYRRTMIKPDGTAWYYDTGPAPVDPHTYAQSAITMLLLKERGEGMVDEARRVLARADDLLWDAGRGGYLSRPASRLGSRVVYLRWAQGWMFRALALAAAHEDRP